MVISEPLTNPAGWRHCHLNETGSTNTDVLAVAREGEDGRLWITAGRQSSGRGRQGRVWVSEPGNLYASALLIDPAPMARLGTLPFVAACALHATLAELKPLKLHKVQIKWPNDILVDGAKISGILLESSVLPNGKVAVACGFGINAAHHPDPVLYKAADLKILGAEISPQALFALLVINFDAVLTIWNRGRGFDAIRTEWLRHAKGIGEMISVNLAGTRIDGIFEDIDRDGCLMLALANGHKQLISAGDVFFPAHSGATS